MFEDIGTAVQMMEQRFAPAGRDVAAWPVMPGASEEEVESVERDLGYRLPESFRALIRRYNFLNVIAGNVSMTRSSTLIEWLVIPNVDPARAGRMRWWRGDVRPKELILIAQSDAHVFLLDLVSGAVCAIWGDDPDAQPKRVTASFALFYQGLASVYLSKLGSDKAEKMAVVVAANVGADPNFPFWYRFAVRAA